VLPGLDDLRDKSVVTLGVQDCYFTYPQIIAFFKRHHIPHVPLAPDRIELTDGFRGAPAAREKFKANIHQRTLFQLLGFDRDKVFSLDASDYESPDFVHDLNVPIGSDLQARFDLIIDGGTLEHVVSPAVSFSNVIGMCQLGGMAVHCNPVDWIPHGFFNFNATFYRDFYLTNGFQETRLNFMAEPTDLKHRDRYYRVFDPDAFFFSLQPAYRTLSFAAYQKISAPAIVLPTQGLYRRVWSGSESVQGIAKPTLRSRVFESIARMSDTTFLSSVGARSFALRRKGRKVWL
jgi:hypothetical protein